jgi:hypothetical protein
MMNHEPAAHAWFTMHHEPTTALMVRARCMHACMQSADEHVKEAISSTIKRLKAIDSKQFDGMFAKPVIKDYPAVKAEYLLAVTEPMDMETLQKRMKNPDHSPGLWTYHDWSVHSPPFLLPCSLAFLPSWRCAPRSLEV